MYSHRGRIIVQVKGKYILILTQKERITNIISGISPIKVHRLKEKFNRKKLRNEW